MKGLIAYLALPVLACGQAAQADEMEDLLGRIDAVELRLKRDLEAEHEAEADLREAETEIVRLREAERELQQKLAGRQQKRAKLAVALEASGHSRRRSQQALAVAVRHAWRSGRQGSLKALLGGRSPGEINRRLAWAGILVRAWTQEAQESVRAAAEAGQLRNETDSLERQLEALKARRAEQISGLEQAVAARRATLRSLRQRIGTAGAEIQQLRTRAATLASLVEDLGRIVDDHPAASLPSITAARGQLGWPLRGRVLERFGSGPGRGQAKWDGILLEAEAGAGVHAPHPGRVVFADWVRGLGFLMVLDHGEGMLSLYAYNDRLLSRKGEMVSKGQIIAHAGNSGGLREPGLYFELRRNGEAVDPLRWLSR